MEKNILIYILLVWINRDEPIADTIFYLTHFISRRCYDCTIDEKCRLSEINSCKNKIKKENYGTLLQSIRKNH